MCFPEDWSERPRPVGPEGKGPGSTTVTLTPSAPTSFDSASDSPGQPGKTRPLGIPTVKDRVVQMAVKLVIEPLFEADFMPC